MDFITTADQTRQDVFSQVKNFITGKGFTIDSYDESRPWGGFYVIDESHAESFIEYFFRDVPEATTGTFERISPKILIVKPGARLSWQYHHRRAEVWKIIGGEAGVIISDTDEQTPVQNKKPGDVIVLQQGQRHRLIGSGEWGIIAEIWQHTDASHPSNEEDIVRVQDDFGR